MQEKNSIKDPKFREKMKKAANRPEVREKQAEHACSGCGEKSKDGSGIDTHHVYPLNDWIDKGHDPSDYPDCWFMTLDKSCHSKADMQPGIFKLPPKKE
jgi:hypothetical protein